MDYKIIEEKTTSKHLDLLSTEKLRCSKCISIINAIFILGAFILV